MMDKGVYRLATAMLLQAVQDAMSVSNGRRNSALRWINGNADGAFSFAFVCRLVNRDPEYIRRFCLRRVAERTVPQPRQAALELRWGAWPAESFKSSAPAARQN
jgi:hypothetical protein